MAFLRTAHAWCGLVLALGLALMGLTGALQALTPEIVFLTTPQARAPAAAPATVGPALDRFEASGGPRVALASINSGGVSLHRLYLNDGRQALVDGAGRPVGKGPPEARFENRVHNLHIKLLAGHTGELLVGVLGLAGLGMVATGAVLWWPARRGFRLSVWPRSARRRDLVATHRNFGLVMSVLLLAQAATGVSLAYDSVFQKFVRQEQPPPAPEAPPSSPTARPWTTVLDAVIAARPSSRLLVASAPDSPTKPYAVTFASTGADAGRQFQAYVAADGRVLRIDPAPAALGNRLMGARATIHGGSYAGDASRLLVAFTGLSLAFLSGLGAWAFLQKLTRRPAAR